MTFSPQTPAFHLNVWCVFSKVLIRALIKLYVSHFMWSGIFSFSYLCHKTHTMDVPCMTSVYEQNGSSLISDLKKGTFFYYSSRWNYPSHIIVTLCMEKGHLNLIAEREITVWLNSASAASGGIWFSLMPRCFQGSHLMRHQGGATFCFSISVLCFLVLSK